eukprot:CAMPEP_0196660698 /NCGR_PEP_ID=MMETSP1086-20130531/40941_1 /TAXON_ID=77921 /ORGANISM="Cyanoptyche  gloeocystis , Strain SAG4.97" /LENGTH=94 /DNA_ID=CAMNT_0041995249 /DNA_START=160 /DNA_END=442 /DNA_ORIENTATION=-
MNEPPGYSPNEKRVINNKLHGFVDLHAVCREHGVKLLSLSYCSWKAIENETFAALGAFTASLMIPTTRSSDTRPPDSMTAFACLPSSEPEATAA